MQLAARCPDGATVLLLRAAAVGHELPSGDRGAGLCPALQNPGTLGCRDFFMDFQNSVKFSMDSPLSFLVIVIFALFFSKNYFLFS